MNGVINLKDVLDYIDIGITDNNNKTHYISYISMIHIFFLNHEGIDSGIRYSLLKQANLILTKLIDYENGELKNDWLRMRSLIVPALYRKKWRIRWWWSLFQILIKLILYKYFFMYYKWRQWKVY